MFLREFILVGFNPVTLGLEERVYNFVSVCEFCIISWSRVNVLSLGAVTSTENKSQSREVIVHKALRAKNTNIHTHGSTLENAIRAKLSLASNFGSHAKFS